MKGLRITDKTLCFGYLKLGTSYQNEPSNNDRHGVPLGHGAGGGVTPKDFPEELIFKVYQAVKEALPDGETRTLKMACSGFAGTGDLVTTWV